MSRVALGLLLVFAAALSASSRAARPSLPTREQTRQATLDSIGHGTPAHTARQLLGQPRRVARQILRHRHLEQWFYEAPFPHRVDVNCPHGQEAFVIQVWAVRPDQP